jgi:hypothetical protein
MRPWRPLPPLFSSSTAGAFGRPQSGHFGHDGQLHGGQATVTGAALAGAADTGVADTGVVDMMLCALLLLYHKKNRIRTWLYTLYDTHQLQ